MIEAARLGVYIGAETGSAEAGIRRVSGMAESAVTDAGKRSTSALGKVLTSLSGAMLTQSVTRPIIAMGQNALAMASDVSESLNKVQVVFGSSAGVIQAFAGTADTAFGLSEQAALDAAGTIGNMYVQLGVGADAAAGFSQQMIGAAADMASFHNAAGGTSEVLGAIQSAFRGEYDALQRYVPTINAAAVEHMALAMSGKASAKELTAAEKAMAAQAIILRDMGPAAGDFARTSTGLANAQRILGASVQNAWASIGQVLLPVASQVVGWLTQLVGRFQGLSPEVQRFGVIAAGLVAALGPVLMVLPMVAAGIGALLSPVGLVVAGVAALAVAFATDFGGIRTAVEGAVSQIGPKLGELAGLFAPMIGRVKESLAGLSASFAPVGAKLSEMVAAVKPIFETLATVVGGVVGVIADLLGNVLAGVLNNLGGIVGGAVDAFTAAFGLVDDVVSGVVATVVALVQGDWAGAWEAAKSLLGDAVAGIGGILEGLLTVADGVMGSLYDGIITTTNDLLGTNIPQWEEFKGLVVAVFQRMVAEIGVWLSGIRTWVETKLAEVKAFIGGFSLADVGAALIQGMIDGIASMASALVSKATGVVSSAIQAAKNLLGIHSPSTVFMEIGVQMIQGLIAGIDATQAEAAAKVAGFLDTIVGTFRDVLGFVGELNALVGGGALTLSSAGLPQPLVFLQHVLLRMGELMRGLMAEPALANLGEEFGDFVERIARVVGPFGEVMAFVGELSALLAGGPLTLNSASLPQPLIFLRDVLRRMGELMQALVSDPVLAAVDEWTVLLAERLGGLAGPFGEVLGFVGELSELVQGGPVVTNSESLPQPLIFLKNVLRRLGELMQQLVADPLTANIDDDLVAFGGRLGAVVGPFGAVLGFVADLSELVQGGPVVTNSESLPQPLIFLKNVLRRLGELVAGLAADPVLAGLDEELAAFSGRLGEMVGPFGEVLGFIGELSELVQAGPVVTNSETLPQPLVFLKNVLRRMGELMLELERDPALAGLDATVAAFAERLSGIAAGLGSALGLLGALGSTVIVTDVEARFAVFVRVWEGILVQLAGISRETRDLADEEMRRFASAAGDIAQGLQRAIGFLVDLGAWKKAENLEELVDELVRVTVYTLEQLREAIGDWRTEGLELATAFGQAVGSVMSGLQAAFELAALAPGSWSVDAGLWQSFFAWVTEVFELAYAWVNRQGTVNGAPGPIYTEGGLALVGAWAQALGSVMQGLQAAANFTLSEDWAAPSADLWWGFYNWVNQVFDLVYEWVTTLHQSPYGGGVFTEDGLALVTAWGSALGSVMQGLSAAASFVLSATWAAPSDDLWWSFYSWVNQVFDLAYEWVTTLHQSPYGGGVFTEAGLGLVNAWGSALGSVMQGLSAAASFVLSATWAAPSDDLWTRFYGWVVSVFDLVQQWVLANVTDDGLGTVSAFGNALSSVMGGLAAAADLTLTAWVAPPAPTWAAFQTWVLGVMDDLYQWVVTTFPDSAAAAANFGVVSALGSAMGAIFGGLQAALDLSQGFWFSEPNTGLWSAFQDWVLGVFMDLHDWVLANFPTSPADATGTFAPVMAFAQALDAITGGLSSALDLLRNVMDTDTGSYQQSEGFTLFQDRVGWLMQGIDTVLDAFLTWVVSGETGWLDTAAAFAGAVGAVFDVLSQALGVFGTLTDEDIPSLDQINAFVDAVLNLFGAFAGGLLTAGGEVGSAVAGLGTTVAGLPGYLPDAATVQFWGYDLAYQLGYGLRNNDLGGDVSAMEAQLRSWLAGAFGASDYGSLRWEMAQMGADLGWALVAGIAGGIDPLGWSGQLYDWMNQAIQALVDYIIAQINGDLGIASPSRVTFGIGLFIPAGLAEGIRAGIPVVGSAMEELFAAVGTRMGGIDGFGVQPSSLAVTQGQRIEVVVSGDVSVGGERLSVAQREDIAQVIIQRLRARG